MKMKITPQTAEQFRDALNDWISNGDREIDAISVYDAGRTNRAEMNANLREMFKACLELPE